MNPNLAHELLAATIEDRLAAACRRRLAAAAAPPAALRWGTRLIALGARLANDPDLLGDLHGRPLRHRIPA